jgi:hypothetical protein
VTELPLTGGCLCGGIRFELTSAPTGANYCHCTRCQRRSGTAASINAAASGEHFRLLRGGELLKAWRHPDGGFEKLFCSECGSHVMSRNPDDHTQIGIRMGAFDADPGVRASYRQFVAYAAPWEEIPDDGLRRYDESGRAAEAERARGGSA